MSPELFTSLGAMLVGIIGAVTSLFLALRKRIAEEDVPALKKRVADLERLREDDRQDYERRLVAVERERAQDRADYQREINNTRAEVLTIDRRYYDVLRWAVASGLTIPDNLRRLNPRNGPTAAGDSEHGNREEGP